MSLSTITIGANSYTAYASVAEADAYLAVDPTRSAAWAALSPDEKGANLVAATRRLDLLPWSGTKVSANQANQWPRTGAMCNGVAVTSTDVPLELENATILQAGSVTLDASNADAGSSGSNIERLKAGSAEVKFFRPVAGRPLQDETVFSLVSCLLEGARDGAGFGCASGTGAKSSFADVNAPDLTDGFP